MWFLTLKGLNHLTWAFVKKKKNHFTLEHNCGLPWWAQTVKYLPAIQEAWVQSLGQEDPPGEENNHSSILA